MQLFEQGADGNVTWTNTTITVGTSVVTQSMGNARHIAVLNNNSSNTLYFTLDGSTPASSSFNLPPSNSISLSGLPAIATLKLLSSGAGSSVSILGW